MRVNLYTEDYCFAIAFLAPEERERLKDRMRDKNEHVVSFTHGDAAELYYALMAAALAQEEGRLEMPLADAARLDTVIRMLSLQLM